RHSSAPRPRPSFTWTDGAGTREYRVHLHRACYAQATAGREGRGRAARTVERIWRRGPANHARVSRRFGWATYPQDARRCLLHPRLSDDRGRRPPASASSWHPSPGAPNQHWPRLALSAAIPLGPALADHRCWASGDWARVRAEEE